MRCLVSRHNFQAAEVGAVGRVHVFAISLLRRNSFIRGIRVWISASLLRIDLNNRRGQYECYWLGPLAVVGRLYSNICSTQVTVVLLRCSLCRYCHIGDSVCRWSCSCRSCARRPCHSVAGTSRCSRQHDSDSDLLTSAV